LFEPRRRLFSRTLAHGAFCAGARSVGQTPDVSGIAAALGRGYTRYERPAGYGFATSAEQTHHRISVAEAWRYGATYALRTRSLNAVAYQVGISDTVRPPHTVEEEAFPEAEFMFLGADREGLIERSTLERLDALLVWQMPITWITVQHLSRCRMVVRFGTGYEKIHIPSLDRAGIAFCNTPDYGTEEVADTACGMILNLQRRISSYDTASRKFPVGWQENVQRPIHRTNSRTLGVVGVGRIGTAVINRMRGFGFRIVGFDPYQPSGHEKAIGYHRVFTLGKLLSMSDIVSIHCPLNDETRGLINSETLALMKRGASLVNTSRGAIIAGFQCLAEALRTGALGSVALDVLPEEPPPADDPLIAAWRNRESWLDGRLIINPHTAYYSEEALYEMRYKAAETVRLFLVEGKIRNRIPA